MKTVAAANCEFKAGQIVPWRTWDRDGQPIEVPAMVLGSASREEWEASRTDRGINAYPNRECITKRTRFYVVSVD